VKEITEENSQKSCASATKSSQYGTEIMKTLTENNTIYSTDGAVTGSMETRTAMDGA
jgi:hypothetical protein